MNQLDNTQQLLDNKIDSILHHLDDANGHSIIYLFRCENDISVYLLSQLLQDKNIESRLMSNYPHFIEMELWYKDSKFNYRWDNYICCMCMFTLSIKNDCNKYNIIHL